MALPAQPLACTADRHPRTLLYFKALLITEFSLVLNIILSQVVEIYKRNKDVFLRPFVTALSTVEWVNPLCIYTKEFYLAMKMNQ